jgi:ADP-heptose:LPS heptosyltransferase
MDGAVRRVLISNPFGNLGDVVLMLPAIAAAHERWPSAALEVVVNDAAADLLLGVPFIESVHRLRHSRLPFLTAYRRCWEVIALYRRAMMQRNYDVAITPRWGADLSYGNYLIYLTGAPVRCGYSTSVDRRPGDWDALLTHLAHGGHGEHESLRDLRVLSRTGLREEEPRDSDAVNQVIPLLQTIAAFSRQHAGSAISGLASGRYVVLSPGGSLGRRLWPLERYAAVATDLALPAETQFVIIGSAAERGLCQRLAGRLAGRALSLAGETSLFDLVALIAGATLFLGNDSGPAHIAGGLGVPTVVVSPFAASCTEEHVNSPLRFRPCGPRVAIVQPACPLPPCFPTCSSNDAHCILQVTVESVVDAASRLLEKRLHAASKPAIH